MGAARCGREAGIGCLGGRAYTDWDGHTVAGRRLTLIQRWAFTTGKHNKGMAAANAKSSCHRKKITPTLRGSSAHL